MLVLAILVYFNFTTKPHTPIHQIVPVCVYCYVCMLINAQNSSKVAQSCLKSHKVA